MSWPRNISYAVIVTACIVVGTIGLALVNLYDQMMGDYDPNDSILPRIIS